MRARSFTRSAPISSASPGSSARRRSRRNSNAHWRSKLPMVLPRNSTSNASPGCAFGGGARHSIEIGLDQRMHFGDIRQIALAARQCVGRHVDGIVAERVSANGLEQMPRLLPHSAAQFDHGHASRKQAGDVPACRPQQTFVGARQAVFGKMRNGLKERAAQFVVEILRMQLLLRLCEAAAHVGREFADGGVLLSFSFRPARKLA